MKETGKIGLQIYLYFDTGLVANPPKDYAFSQDSEDVFYIKFDDGLERGDLNFDDVSDSGPYIHIPYIASKICLILDI